MSRFSPISFQFITAGIAQQARASLIQFSSAQKNDQTPSWEGHNGEMTTAKLGVPITDISHWQGRYVLTTLKLITESNEELMIDDAVISVSTVKNIVKTSLVGLNGTIKEYINTGDYEIKIMVGVVAVKDGVIVDEYPEDGMRFLRDFLEETTSLSVESRFLDLFGITKIVVTGFSAVQQTYSNRQTIEIKALSDVDYEIKNTEY